jgi:hypothetical protein
MVAELSPPPGVALVGRPAAPYLTSATPPRLTGGPHGGPTGGVALLAPVVAPLARTGDRVAQPRSSAAWSVPCVPGMVPGYEVSHDSSGVCPHCRRSDRRSACRPAVRGYVEGVLGPRWGHAARDDARPRFGGHAARFVRLRPPSRARHSAQRCGAGRGRSRDVPRRGRRHHDGIHRNAAWRLARGHVPRGHYDGTFRVRALRDAGAGRARGRIEGAERRRHPRRYPDAPCGPRSGASGRVSPRLACRRAVGVAVPRHAPGPAGCGRLHLRQARGGCLHRRLAAGERRRPHR